MTKRPCPTPGKKAYTQRLAIRATIGSSRTFGKPMRHYHCECGAWHVTSRVL